MPDLQDLSKDKRLRNHFNIDKKRRTNQHRQSSPHFHSYYELYYMEEGQCKFFLTDTVYSLQKGHMLLIPPGEFHTVVYDTKGMHDRFNLYFDKEKIDPCVRSYLSIFDEDPSVRHFRVAKEKEEEVSRFLYRLLELYRMENDFGDLTIHYFLPAFLLSLSKNTVSIDAAEDRDPKEAALENAVQYVATHYAETITLEDAAGIAGFTPTYFSRKFKELVGICFRDYLTHIRLKESTKLLRQTTIPVQEVANRCGFHSSNYFGDTFRQAYGMSPRDYRKKEEI